MIAAKDQDFSTFTEKNLSAYVRKFKIDEAELEK